MKIQAFMPVFNEADILLYSIDHLMCNRIAVHLIDGYSTDGSWALIQGAAKIDHRVTCEQFPYPDDGIWNCTRMLMHIEELALASGAEWCMLNDVDEWRQSIWKGEPLLVATERVARDYPKVNVIDFLVYDFLPVDDNFRGGDPEKHFNLYTQDSMICKLPQHKLWRNDTPVNIHTHGGHVMIRPNMRVSPERWIMKHYGYRSLAQQRAKLEARLSRRCHEEHRRGWGVHYDGAVAALADPATLKPWD